MPIKGLEECKSAVTITGRSNVTAFLTERLAKRAKNLKELGSQALADGPLEAQTDCNGNMSVIKQSGFLVSDYQMPVATELEAMAKSIGLPWDPAYAERAIPWWASDERVDRHGDIVEQSWIFEDFQHNPVLLYCHEWGMPPIGNILNWVVAERGDKGYSGPALRLLGVFATEEQYPFADQIYRLAKAKFLRTVSVGFFPQKIIDVEDEKERSKLGLGRWGYIYQDNELVELSPCSIPANQGAFQVLNAARKSGILKPQDLQILREIKRVEGMKRHMGNTEWKTLDAQLCAGWKAMYPEVKVPGHKNVEDTVLCDDIELVTSVQVLLNGGKNEAKESEVTLDDLAKRMTKLEDAVTSQVQILSDIREALEKTPEPNGGVDPQKGGDDTRVSTIQSILAQQKK